MAPKFWYKRIETKGRIRAAVLGRVTPWKCMVATLNGRSIAISRLLRTIGVVEPGWRVPVYHSRHALIWPPRPDRRFLLDRLGAMVDELLEQTEDAWQCAALYSHHWVPPPRQGGPLGGDNPPWIKMLAQGGWAQWGICLTQQHCAPRTVSAQRVPLIPFMSYDLPTDCNLPSVGNIGIALGRWYSQSRISLTDLYSKALVRYADAVIFMSPSSRKWTSCFEWESCDGTSGGDCPIDSRWYAIVLMRLMPTSLIKVSNKIRTVFLVNCNDVWRTRTKYSCREERFCDSICCDIG